MNLSRFCYVLIMPVIVLFPILAGAQQTKLIRFKNTPEPYAPVHYRIGSIVDEREDTSNIGIMRAGFTNRPTPVNFSGGLAPAMAAYIQQNVKQHAELSPIDIHIKTLKITETTTGMKERATLDYALLFVNGSQPLFTFTGNAYIETGMDASAYIERLVRQGIGSTLRQMDDSWMQASALMAPPSVTVKVIIDTASSGNRIAYTTRRPLNFTDFNGIADDLSLGSAATYSGIDVRYQTQTLGAQTALTIHIAPYVDKSKSWYRLKARSAVVLSHEQRHFDISAAHACMLKRSIEAYNFPPPQGGTDEIERIIQDMLAKAMQQSQDMQTAYDTETVHGGNAKTQQKWNSKIAELLTTGACY
jgi:hypothetical protein